MLSRPRISYRTRAVVTGAGSGIGRAFALELARREGQVICSDLDLAAVRETVRLVTDAGGRAIAAQADVRSEQAMRDLAGAARDWFGLPTLIVNNAGVGAGGAAVGEAALEDWRTVLDVNLWGVIHGTHVFLPLIQELGIGGVINVASAAGFAAAPAMAPYNVSKAGVLALSETLAAELAGTAVRVTVVCPTFVPTAIFDSDLIAPAQAAGARERAEQSGSTPESVVLAALEGLDRGRLYVLPQTDAKVVWRAKRLLPGVYPGMAGRVVAQASDRLPDQSPGGQ